MALRELLALNESVPQIQAAQAGDVYHAPRPVAFADGSAAAPSITFAGDLDAGFYLAGASDVRLSIGGNDRFKQFFSDFILRSDGRLGFGSSVLSSPDTFLQRETATANTLAQRNGVNAQTYKLYNTFTDTSNYERLSIAAQAADDVLLNPEAAGTGTLRGLQLVDGSGRLGFFGTTAIVKPAITGSRAGNAALADLLTKLASLGLLTDSSS